MKLPDLTALSALEETATRAWREVYHPTPSADESINPIVNREQRFIRAVRADQAVAGWYLDHAEAIKALIWAGYQVVLNDLYSHEPHQ